MRALLIYLIIQFPLMLSAQSSDSAFLMYTRHFGYSSARSYSISLDTTNKFGLVPTDTVYWISSIMRIKKSTAHIRDFHMLDNRTGKAEKWKVKSDKQKVTIEKGNLKGTGIIVRDSILARKGSYDSMEFFLVPISAGIKLTPFEGQIICRERGLTMKIVLTTMENKGVQNAFAIHDFDSIPLIIHGKANYPSKVYNSVMSIGDGLRFVQPVKLPADSILIANSFNSVLRIGDRLTWKTEFLKKDFPPRSKIEEIQSNLEGAWSVTEGSVINDSTLVSAPLTDCRYKFSFSRNTISIERTFSDSTLADMNETFAWEINPTGDYISVGEYGAISDHYIILKKLNSRTARIMFSDRWNAAGKWRRKRSFLTLTKE